MKDTKKGFFDSIRAKLVAVVIGLIAVPIIVLIAISSASSASIANDNMETLDIIQVQAVQLQFTNVIAENRALIGSAAIPKISMSPTRTSQSQRERGLPLSSVRYLTITGIS